MTRDIDGNNFLVKKDGDKMSIGIPENLKAQVNRLMKYCLNEKNGYLYLKIGPPRRRRTSGIKSQNNAIHGYCAQICAENGGYIDDLKMMAKIHAMRRGYPAMKDENGNVIMSYVNDLPVPESSAQVTTIEAGYLIDELQQIAAEHGIVLKDE